MQTDDDSKPEAEAESDGDWTRRQVGRLAMRVEGEWWTAYYALPDTMAGAIEIGRVKMGAAKRNAAIKNGFMSLMQYLITDILEEGSGGKVSWPNEPHKAPEHERAGKA